MRSAHGEQDGPSASELVLRQAQSAVDSLVRAEDIKGASHASASRALARLAQKGALKRVAKGLYFAPKKTLLGESHPSELSIAQKALEGKTRPTGATAANLLGLSTQVPGRPQIVAYTNALPDLSGKASISRRRGRVHRLSQLEGALLEFLRDRGAFAETDPAGAITKLSYLLRHDLNSSRLKELRDVGLEEPPRVRAMLGALFEFTGLRESLWQPLRASLNPLSKFDFGLLAELPNARGWQAK